MRNISGFVFVGGYHNGEIKIENLYGPDGERLYGNMVGNGLRVFDDCQSTRIAMLAWLSCMKQSTKRTQVIPASLKLDIATNLAEAEAEFVRDRSLVVLAQTEHGYEFLGPSSSTSTARDSTINGTQSMCLNGWKTFNEVRAKEEDALDWVRYVVNNCSRQGSLTAKVARLDIGRIGEPIC